MEIIQEWVEGGGVRNLVFHCDGQEFYRLSDALDYRRDRRAYRARKGKRK